MNTFVSATLHRATVTGINGPGPISVTGTKVGDVVVAVILNGTDSEPSVLEHTITVANQIQQLGGDHTADTIVAITAR